MEKKFIQWLASQEMFKGMSEETLIKEINTLVEKDPETVKALVAEFNKSQQKFAKGGKIDYMVSKFQNGGAALRQAQRQAYRDAMSSMRNDEEMNKYRRGYLRDIARDTASAVTLPESAEETVTVERIRPRDVYDRDEARQIMLDKGVKVKQTRTDWDGNVLERIRKGNVGDGRVLAKKAKSAAVDGFDESMYNWDGNQEFDRQRFRERKREAREANPEWNWRQRRAWALIDNEGEPRAAVEPRNPNIDLPSIWDRKIDIPAFNRGKATVDVGGPSVVSVEVDPRKYRLIEEKSRLAPKRMGFDQFAGMLDDRLRAQKGFTTGSDTANFQAWRAKEYKKYAADPANYTWTAMPEGWKASREEMAQLRNEGILANRRGTGYYDPNDNSQSYIFGDKSWSQYHSENGMNPTKKSYSFVDAEGNPVTDEREIARAAAQITDPEIRKYFAKYLNTGDSATTVPAETVRAQEQNVGKVGQSDFSKAMNAVQAGIVATAAAPVVVEATADAAKELGKYAYKAGKQMIQNGRSMYGRSPQMLQQNRWYTWTQGRVPGGQFGPNVFKGGQFYQGFGNGLGQMAPQAAQLWQPGMRLSGEVISQLPTYLRHLAPFLKNGGKLKK